MFVSGSNLSATLSTLSNRSVAILTFAGSVNQSNVTVQHTGVVATSAPSTYEGRDVRFAYFEQQTIHSTVQIRHVSADVTVALSATAYSVPWVVYFAVPVTNASRISVEESTLSIALTSGSQSLAQADCSLVSINALIDSELEIRSSSLLVSARAGPATAPTAFAVTLSAMERSSISMVGCNVTVDAVAGVSAAAAAVLTFRGLGPERPSSSLQIAVRTQPE